MSSFQVGDSVLVKNRFSAKFERQSVVVQQVRTGVWKVKFDDGVMRIVTKRFMRSSVSLNDEGESVCDVQRLPSSQLSESSSYTVVSLVLKKLN